MDEHLDAAAVLGRLCAVLDAHDWTALPDLLHATFTCTLVHTGETFDREGWVRLNAEYPGFEGLEVEDLIGSGDRAVARCRVRGRVDGAPVVFAVASFATASDGRLTELTEVWTDVDQAPPEGTRSG